MNSENDLLCMFTSEVTEENGTYTVEVPASEVELGTVETGDSVRVGLHLQPSTGKSGDKSQSTNEEWKETPPVKKGEVRTVTIESLGDQGDGIAKVDSGFVLIVPDTNVGDEVTAEVVKVTENFAIAEKQPEDKVIA